jgi:hypothetical protein
MRSGGRCFSVLYCPPGWTDVPGLAVTVRALSRREAAAFPDRRHVVPRTLVVESSAAQAPSSAPLGRAGSGGPRKIESSSIAGVGSEAGGHAAIPAKR